MNENMELPKIMQEFCKNKPSAEHDNLYLFEVVDMDGNIVEEKVGMNLLTEYGVRRIFTENSYNIDGSNNSFYNFYLGNGCSDPSATIDPSQNSLVSYISALGARSSNASYSDSSDAYNASFPLTYDSVTKNIYQRIRVTKYMWDYTDGDNLEYEINEFGAGAVNSPTSIVCHGLVYDETGTRSSITKRPNTRLYVTPIYCFCINAEMINDAYDNGLYLLISPVSMYSPRRDYYIIPAVNTPHFDADYNIRKNYEKTISPVFTASDNSRVINQTPDGLTSSSKSFFFYEKNHYMSGFVFGEGNVSDVANGATWGVGSSQSNEWIGITYEELPAVGYDTIKNITCDCVYANNLNAVVEHRGSTVNINTPEALRIHKVFDIEPKPEYTNWNTIPVAQFDISSLCLYNHRTKDYDIAVPHVNGPTTKYMLTHFHVRLLVRVTYNNRIVNAYVMVNPLTEYRITGFNNTNIIVVATDAYWDVSTYAAGTIQNLSDIPLSLQQKRYYIIIQGNSTKLNPIYDETTFVYHKLDPVIRPFELTDNGCPMNVSRTWQPLYSDSPSRHNTFAIPIFSQTYGFFLTQEDLIYYNMSTKTLIASYKLYMDDDTQMCPMRRWITEDEDKIISFHQYTCYDPTYPSSSYKTFTKHMSKSVLRIWTVGDDSTTPTAEDIELLYSGNDETNARPDYSFTDKGFLTVQQTDFNECAVVDIYGVTNNDTATFYILPDVKHCRCLNRTTYCVYQNMTESHDTTYVFDIYDMSTKTVIDQFTIDNGNEYTIYGLFGWRDWVYVNVKNNNTGYSFLYDISKHGLQLLSEDLNINNTRSTGNSLEDQLAVVSNDECIIYSGYRMDTRVILAKDPSRVIRLLSTTTDAEYLANYYNYFPKITSTHNGDHLILVSLTRYGSFTVSNLGLLIDTEQPLDIYSKYNVINVADHGGAFSPYYAIFGGSFAVLDNGIVFVDSYPSGERPNKIYYLPIESMANMRMIGTTKHMNAYNDPVRFWGKTIQLKYSNDLSRIINRS